MSLDGTTTAAQNGTWLTVDAAGTAWVVANVGTNPTYTALASFAAAVPPGGGDDPLKPPAPPGAGGPPAAPPPTDPKKDALGGVLGGALAAGIQHTVVVKFGSNIYVVVNQNDHGGTRNHIDIVLRNADVYLYFPLLWQGGVGYWI